MPDPAPTLPSVASERRFLLVAGALYLALSLVLLPETYLISDEASYLGLATAFLRGHVHLDLSSVSTVTMWRDEAGHTVAKHPPGTAAFLVPFLLLGGLRAAFLAMPLAHLAGFVLCARLFRALGRDPRLAVLYLLHPTAVLFARGVMGDVLAASFLLLALSEVARKRASFLAGAGLGALVLVRPQEAVVALPVGLVALVEAGRAGRGELAKGAFGLALGGAPFVALLLGYDLATTGNPLVLPYERLLVGSDYFSPQHLAGNAGFYALALVLTPPLLGLAWLLDRPYRALVVAPVAASLVFYCFYGFLDKGSDVVESAVRGLRFHLPVLPLLLASYASFLGRVFHGEKARERLPWALLALLLVGAGALSWRHEERVKEQAALERALDERVSANAVLLADDGAAKLHQSLRVPRELREYGFALREKDAGRAVFLAVLEEQGRADYTNETRRTYLDFLRSDPAEWARREPSWSAQHPEWVKDHPDLEELAPFSKGTRTLRVFKVSWKK